MYADLAHIPLGRPLRSTVVGAAGCVADSSVAGCGVWAPGCSHWAAPAQLPMGDADAKLMGAMGAMGESVGDMMGDMVGGVLQGPWQGSCIMPQGVLGCETVFMSPCEV